MKSEFQPRLLGASGISVPPLGTGTNRWRIGENDEPVFQAFTSLLDGGMNFFDSAETYGMGKSERLLGACAKRDPRPVMIASKFRPSPTRLFRRQFMKALDATLTRLGREKIDLYYIHFPHPLLSVETLMDMMAQAVGAGKVRAVGVSNFDAGRMRRAAARLERHGIPLAANQVRYNLLHRQPEEDGVLDACRELNVALVAHTPLARRQLIPGTGAGAASSSPSSAMSKGESSSRHAAIEETLQRIAQQRGKTAAQVALNWLLRKDERVIPIPGTAESATCVGEHRYAHLAAWR